MKRLSAPFAAAIFLLAFASPAWAFDLTNLEAHWKLNEASGTRVDSHGTNDLTDNNTVTQAAGKIDNATQHTAANSEYLSIADNASLSMGAGVDFTIVAWVYLDAKGSNRPIISKWNSDTSAEYNLWYNTGNDRFQFHVRGTAETSVQASTFGIPSTATWYFVVAYHDATADTINISINDGTVDSATHTTDAQDQGNPVQVGGFTVTSEYMDGRIDSVSVFKRVLTAQEITDLYNSGNGKDYPFTSAAAVRSFGVIIYSASSALGGPAFGGPAAFPIGGLW